MYHFRQEQSPLAGHHSGFFIIIFFLINSSVLSCSLCVAMLLHRHESRCLSPSAGTNLYISCPHLEEAPKSYWDLVAAAVSFICETPLIGCRHIYRWRWGTFTLARAAAKAGAWSSNRLTDIRFDLLPGRVRPDRKKMLCQEWVDAVCIFREIPAMIMTWPRLSCLSLCVSK